MVKQCFLCSALGLLLAGWDCTASDGLSLGQLRAQCALQWNSWKQQPWSQQLQRQSSQPQCTSPIHPSIHPSAQTFSKLSMKQHHVSLISNYVSIWCCMHISLFFQHNKLHSIHPPTQVVSKQSGSLILICCQFSSCHIHATSASPKPSVQQQSSRRILQKSIWIHILKRFTSTSVHRCMLTANTDLHHLLQTWGSFISTMMLITKLMILTWSAITLNTSNKKTNLIIILPITASLSATV